MFNGGTRKRLLSSASSHSHHRERSSPVKSPERTNPSPPSFQLPPPSPTRVPPLPLVMDYMWHKHPLSPYSALPWLGLPPTAPLLLPSAEGKIYPSAFRPVYSAPRPAQEQSQEDNDDEPVDIETCNEDDVKPCWSPARQSPQVGLIRFEVYFSCKIYVISNVLAYNIQNSHKQFNELCNFKTIIFYS